MKYPEGPSTPKILQMLQWVTDPVGYMEAAARDYGDIFNTLVLGKPRLFVSNLRSFPGHGLGMSFLRRCPKHGCATLRDQIWVQNKVKLLQ